jgi:hypothetical protein
VPSDKTRSLFGTVRRERVLAALARGPLHVRALAREVCLGERGAWDVVERFRRMGVVAKRDRPGSYVLAALDPRFPGSDELRDLIAALHPESALPADRPAWRRGLDAAPRGGDRFADLFGTAMRTRLLIVLALVGETTPDRARRLLRIRRRQALLDAVRRLRALGVVTWRHRGNDARIALDAEYTAHVPLRRLLLKLADESPTIGRAVAVSRVPAHREPTPEERLPFLRPAHARMLLDLRRGPLRVADLVERRGVTRATALATARALEACGLVVVAQKARHATVALNAARDDFDAWWTLLRFADPDGHPARRPAAAFGAHNAANAPVPMHDRIARIMHSLAVGETPRERPALVAAAMHRLARLGIARRRSDATTIDEALRAALAAVLAADPADRNGGGARRSRDGWGDATVRAARTRRPARERAPANDTGAERRNKDERDPIRASSPCRRDTPTT